MLKVLIFTVKLSISVSMLLSYLSVTLMLLLKMSQNVDGLMCDSCVHKEVFTSSAELMIKLKARGFIKIDNNCKQFNSNYVTNITESCNTVCLFDVINLNATLDGNSFQFVSAQRGCTTVGSYDPKTHSVDTCQDFSRSDEAYYRKEGYSSVTAATLQCYCNENECNGRNVSTADNSKMTEYFNTGQRMTTTPKSGRFICDTCIHTEAYSSSAEIIRKWKSDGTIKIDNNCKQFNSSYVTDKTESCNTICVLHVTNVHATYRGDSISTVTVERGCATIGSFDPEIHSVDTCQDLSTRNLEFKYQLSGYSNVRAASVQCYCNENNCNGRNTSSTDNAKMTEYFNAGPTSSTDNANNTNAGPRMTSPSLILMCWVVMIGLVTKNN